MVDGQLYFVESGLGVAGVGHAELAVGLIDRVVQCWEVMGFGDGYDEALEVFGGVVGGGDREELMADVEVEAFGAGEVGFEGAWFELHGFDGFQAVTAGVVDVFGAVEVKDVVAKSWGVVAAVLFEGVAGFEVKEGVVPLRAVVLFDGWQQRVSVDVAAV